MNKLKLIEEITNELLESNYTVGDLAKAARNSLPKRIEADKNDDSYHAASRLERAKEIAELPDSNKPAKKLINAARKVVKPREQKYKDEFNTEKDSLRPDKNTERNIKRSDHAFRLVNPKLEEALSELIQIIEDYNKINRLRGDIKAFKNNLKAYPAEAEEWNSKIKQAKKDLKVAEQEHATENRAALKRDIESGKVNSYNESLQLIKEAQSLMSSIFEVDYEGEKDKINPNKAEKKDKVDVVSVADELFPAGGTAKQQYNQKIIDKINDMIEGKATLEDLIQLVRQKSAAKKAIATHECLDDAVELLEEMIDKTSKK